MSVGEGQSQSSANTADSVDPSNPDDTGNATTVMEELDENRVRKAGQMILSACSTERCNREAEWLSIWKMLRSKFEHTPGISCCHVGKESHTSSLITRRFGNVSHLRIRVDEKILIIICERRIMEKILMMSFSHCMHFWMFVTAAKNLQALPLQNQVPWGPWTT